MNQINVSASNRPYRAIKIIVWLAIGLAIAMLAGLWFGNVYETNFSSTAIAATRTAETCRMPPQTFVALPYALQNELKDQCSMPPMVGP